MKQFNEIYEANKELDQLFYDKHPLDEEVFKKNVLELMVEIGELANETRCFKYWSKKGPSPKEDILDEYADCIQMILMFCDYQHISLDEEFDEVPDRELNEEFIYLYSLCPTLLYNFNKDNVKEIFANLIYLGRLLNFSDKDIIDGCLTKINRNIERLEKDFV